MMPEPITCGMLCLAAFTGILGNRADSAAMATWKAITSRLKKGGDGLPLNHDLLRAGQGAFHQSIEWLCAGLLSSRFPAKSLVEVWLARKKQGTFWDHPLFADLEQPERIWLKQLQSLSTDHAALARFDSRLLAGIDAYEAAISLRENEKGTVFEEAFLQWCQENITAGKRPADFDRCVREGWPPEPQSSERVPLYQAFCLFLCEAIKHDPAVYHLFSAQQVVQTQELLRNIRQDLASSLAESKSVIVRELLADSATTFQKQGELLVVQLQTEIGPQFGRLETRLAEMTARFGQLDGSLAGLFGICTASQWTLNRIDETIQSIAETTRGVDAKIDRLLAQDMAGSSPALFSLEDRPAICIGRDTQISAVIASMLDQSMGRKAIGILGEPGIGKSTVALRALHAEEVVSRFGARRAFVRCEAVLSADGLISGIGQSLGLDIKPITERAVFGALASEPAALVLDNFETPWTGEDATNVEQLLSRLSALPGTVVVVTLRGPHLPHGPNWAPTVELHPLDIGEAQRIFVAHASDCYADDPDLATLVQEMEGIPLALFLLASVAASTRQPNLKHVLKRWRAQRTALLRRTVGGNAPPHRSTSIEAAYEVSLEGAVKKNAMAKRILAVMSILPYGVRHCDLFEICGDVSEVDRAIDLVAGPGRGLVSWNGDRLRMLPLLREYGVRRFKKYRKIREKTTVFFLTLATDLGGKVGTSESVMAASRLSSEIGNIQSLILDVLSQKDVT